MYISAIRLRLNVNCQLNTSYPEVASTGEVLAVLVEGHGHDAVSRVEGLLNAVAVVNVNVDVQHALVISEQTIRGIWFKFDQRFRS